MLMMMMNGGQDPQAAGQGQQGQGQSQQSGGGEAK